MLATSTLPAHTAHFVQFFDSDEQLICSVTAFVRRALETNCTCVVVATSAHREAIATRLESSGLDPAALAAAYRYISLDAEVSLRSFMDESGPDAQRFHQHMGLLLRQAAARGQPVHVYGEMVGVLASSGRMQQAIRLEEFWNELSRYHTFTLFCGNPSAPFDGDQRSRTRVCALHSHVVHAQ
jgi:MEDS: MEthanogen/methylotroph, DcmR Sensory domain